MRASGDPKFLADGPWGQMVAMFDATYRSLLSGASWSGNERNHLFLGIPGAGQFEEISGISGADDPGDSRAFATLDFDHDGRMDFALANVSKPRFRLLRNQTDRVLESENKFVAFRFVGGNDQAKPSQEWSARDALGARVELELGEGRTIHREHRRDDGYKAQHTSTLLVGIGRADEVKEVRIVWPSGRTQNAASIPFGTLVTLYENPAQSPTGKSEVRESYRRDAREESLAAGPGISALRLDGAHGEEGLTVYTTMSTSCAACMRAMPILKAVRKTFRPNELTLVGVPVSVADTAEELSDYVAKKNPPYAVQIGLSADKTQRVRNIVSARLHADGNQTPASIVTDASGRILSARWGVPTISELKKLRAEALSDHR